MRPEGRAFFLLLLQCISPPSVHASQEVLKLQPPILAWSGSDTVAQFSEILHINSHQNFACTAVVRCLVPPKLGCDGFGWPDKNLGHTILSIVVKWLIHLYI